MPQRIKRQPIDDQGGYLVRAATGDVNYWSSFVADPLTVLFFLLWEPLVLHSRPLIVIGGYASGLLSWSLLEYAAHRWFYHQGETPAHTGHKMHHESPKQLIAMPWFIITGIMAGLWFVFAYQWQFRGALVFIAGLLTGFVYYGALHHIHHHFSFKNSWYRKLRRHHVIHHQLPHVNFGVTSPLWDYIFRTNFRRATVSRKPRMRLLIEYCRLRWLNAGDA
jgi:hypothetical protein